MNSRQRKTLEAVFADPVRADIKWADIEALFAACAQTLKKGADRVCVSKSTAFSPISTARIREKRYDTSCAAPIFPGSTAKMAGDIVKQHGQFFTCL